MGADMGLTGASPRPHPLPPARRDPQPRLDRRALRISISRAVTEPRPPRRAGRPHRRRPRLRGPAAVERAPGRHRVRVAHRLPPTIRQVPAALEHVRAVAESRHAPPARQPRDLRAGRPGRAAPPSRRPGSRRSTRSPTTRAVLGRALANAGIGIVGHRARAGHPPRRASCSRRATTRWSRTSTRPATPAAR